MSKLLHWAHAWLAPLLPKAGTDHEPLPTIESYGQSSSGIPREEIQPIMEWLFASLLNAKYDGLSHLVWYNDAAPNPQLETAVKAGIKRGEPTLLYCCGSRVQPPPDGYYWRLMAEHPSQRIYQLEVEEEG